MTYLEQVYKGKNDWWRYLVTLVLVMIGWQVVGVIPLTVAAFSKANDLEAFFEASKDAFMSLGINSNLYLVLLIATFFFGLVFLILGVKYVHQRRFITVITSRSKVDSNRVIFAFVLWFGVSTGFLLLGYLMEPESYIWNFKPIPFFTLLVISFVLLPFQTSFEELLFRGYFMQGLAFLFKNALAPLLITSVVFGLLHGFNPEVQKLGNMIMVFYIGTGLMFGICTLMDEGTEIALGMHAANNIVAALIVTSDWMVFRTDALLVDTSEPSVNFETFIPVFIIYPIILLVLSKKYRWKGWKEKLMGPVEPPALISEENRRIPG